MKYIHLRRAGKSDLSGAIDKKRKLSLQLTLLYGARERQGYGDNGDTLTLEYRRLGTRPVSEEMKKLMARL
jgi:hypothetical protein